MTNKELIEIAKTCGFGECAEECPYYTEHYNALDVVICSQKLISDLADALEKATNTIPVGNGKDYTVVNE